MTQSKMYKRHRFPRAIIQYTVWLYHRFSLSLRDIEDLLAQRGISINFEAIRQWASMPTIGQSYRMSRRGAGGYYHVPAIGIAARFEFKPIREPL